MGVQRAVAFIVITAEIACGFLLFVGYQLRLALWAASALFVVFIAVISPVLDAGRNIDCGCFGPLVGGKIDACLLVRDLILLSLTVVLLTYHQLDKAPTPVRIGEFVKRGANNFMIVVLLFLASEAVLLMMQNRNLRLQVESASAATIPTPLQSGEKVMAFRSVSLRGDTVAYDYGGNTPKHLLFVFSPKCGLCELNVPRWNLLTEKYRSNSISIVGVSIHRFSETVRFTHSTPVAFDVLVNIDPEFRRLYHIYQVPVTLLVKKPGIVERVWVGELTPDRLIELESLLSVHLALVQQTNNPITTEGVKP